MGSSPTPGILKGREAIQERRQRVLLITPAALRDGTWRSFFLRHLSIGSVETVSYEELSSDSNLLPRVPAAMAAAIELLDDHPPLGYTQEEFDRYKEALSAPYGAREERAIRSAIRDAGTSAPAAEAVVHTVRELGSSPRRRLSCCR